MKKGGGWVQVAVAGEGSKGRSGGGGICYDGMSVMRSIFGEDGKIWGPTWK
jgi:hypothetical protein